jgi:hypothetical protein
VDCDALVEKKLANELVKLGYKGIHDVAKWMGQPYDAQYPDTSRKYMNCERTVMQDILERLHTRPEKPLVIDTTGSVIYVGDDITQQLKILTHTVYLKASENHVAKLFERYTSNPKPVIWGNSFVQRDDETSSEALQRCYPELLGFRAERYRALAQTCIPFEKHKTPQITWTELMAQI